MSVAFCLLRVVLQCPKEGNKKKYIQLKEGAEITSTPFKTLQRWKREGELTHPVLLKIKGSNRIVLDKEPFLNWFKETKLGQAPSTQDNLRIYGNRLKAMREARNLVRRNMVRR